MVLRYIANNFSIILCYVSVIMNNNNSQYTILFVHQSLELTFRNVQLVANLLKPPGLF